jgi:hypothetical protein
LILFRYAPVAGTTGYLKKDDVFTLSPTHEAPGKLLFLKLDLLAELALA